MKALSDLQNLSAGSTEPLLSLLSFPSTLQARTMVNTRRPVKKSRRHNIQRTLWCRRYPSSIHRPYFEDSITVCETEAITSPRFPRIEDNFDDAHVQPHFHDFTVLLRHGHKETSFRVFSKRGSSLPTNKCITPANVAANADENVDENAVRLAGNVVFMCLGAGPDGQSPISMRARDARMVDYVFDSPTFRKILADFQGPDRVLLPTVPLVVTRPRAFPR
ncbi:hypothetical protein B0H14DRAFT_3462003 [Mycena olivaceomarginata]|nr:hypothetical protein B0H14DRAFT_3462003 [Mycena olivaceomarginata]